MPVYNEDPTRVFAGLEATWRSLQRTGEENERHFDLFILSDTRKPEIAEAEEAAWAALCHRLNAEGRIFYRRRESNTGRKAGNIADFLRQWGLAYDHMLVLDADSIMSGETMVALAKLMQDNPGTGIIQTLPAPVNQETLFGRILQFGSRVYGPALVERAVVVAVGRGQLLGPQRDHPDQRLHRALRAADPVGAGAAGRRDPQPRLRRGGPDAQGRLAGLDRAGAGRQLRGTAAQRDRLRRARPALVPGQPAASAAAAGQGAASA